MRIVPVTARKRRKKQPRTITPQQCRTARAWLGWSQQDLAENSGVSLRCIADFELEARKPLPATMDKIASAIIGPRVIIVEPDGLMLLTKKEKGKT